MTAKIIGVHPIAAPEPCHLIEMYIEERGNFDWSSVTQESPGQPTSNWQVAYDEFPVNLEPGRWGFFFHYLDFKRPLLTPVGALDLPKESPLPSYLEDVKYVAP